MRPEVEGSLDWKTMNDRSMIVLQGHKKSGQDLQRTRWTRYRVARRRMTLLCMAGAEPDIYHGQGPLVLLARQPLSLTRFPD